MREIKTSRSNDVEEKKASNLTATTGRPFDPRDPRQGKRRETWRVRRGDSDIGGLDTDGILRVEKRRAIGRRIRKIGERN